MASAIRSDFVYSQPEGLKHRDYTIAWIAALHIELAAAIALLDEEHVSLPLAPGDTNIYTLGKFGDHNVVIANLPDGTYGTTSAATVAANLLRSFPNVRFGLMVGVGGGVPEPYDLRLGDIVVASPARDHGGVIQYDFGAAIQNQKFVRRGSLNKPPIILRNAVAKMRGDADVSGYNFQRHFDRMLQRHPRMRSEFSRPSEDVLYDADHVYLDQASDHEEYSLGGIIPRRSRPEAGSKVFYGAIGSANQVLRNAHLRDELHKETGIICFEMEAAGLMDSFPCLVIRGISDYADSHKNKGWQPYASAIAGAFAKELLLRIPPVLVSQTPEKTSALEAATRIELANNQKNNDCLRDLRQTDPRRDKMRIKATINGSWDESRQWVETNDRFRSWICGPDSQLLCITGDKLGGKTMVISAMIDAAESEEFKGTSTAYFYLPGDSDSPQIRRSNTGTAVLRGLMFMLLMKNPTLIEYVREQYDYSGKELFEDLNSWYTLSDIFGKILGDPITNGSTFFVNALDVCSEFQEDLLHLITKLAYTTPTKWVISLKTWPKLERQLQHLSEGTRLSIELATGPGSLQLWYTSAAKPDQQGRRRQQI